jgi:thiamine biosynthesis lipoprotein
MVVAVAVWPRAGIYVRNYEGVLGTSMELKVLATSDAAAVRAESAVLDEIDRESHILSGYDASSEFRQWLTSTGAPARVSPELFDVLDLFDRWRSRTGGALDAAAETVSAVWRQAATTQQLPTDAALARAVAETAERHWTLNTADRTATHLDAAPLMLNSFTKTFIVDRAAAAAMRQPGVKGVVVNVGGDLVVRGNIADTVDVTDPRANADNARPLLSLDVRDRAVATSGGYRRGFDIQGVHYSHIVDPRTGRPTGHVLSATVVAPVAADAGALATAFCVLSPEDSERLASTVSGAEFLLVLADGREIESAGWRSMVRSPEGSRALPAPVATLKAAEQTAAKPEFELTISLEIAQQQMRAQRPYVAVWIEDKDRFPVRTLAVWYMERESRYLTDLKAWYRGDRLRNMAEGSEILRSVSSATRGPGRYTLVWDGKDNVGKAVKPGTYTVLIEAAREHGTYQIMRQDMDLSGVARKVELPGNVEVSAASLDYHRAGK